MGKFSKALSWAKRKASDWRNFDDNSERNLWRKTNSLLRLRKHLNGSHKKFKSIKRKTRKYKRRRKNGKSFF